MKLFGRHTASSSSSYSSKDETLCCSPQRSRSVSLATGSTSFDGEAVENLVPSPSRIKQKAKQQQQQTQQSCNTKIFRRNDSSFLRVTDLDMSMFDSPTSSIRTTDTTATTTTTSSSAHSDNSSNLKSTTAHHQNNYHCASVDPPPGIGPDPAELWIALDDGEGQHAPIAPFAVQALVESARHVTLENSDLWTPTHTKQHAAGSWQACTWESASDEAWKHCLAPATDDQNQVLVWTGTLPYIGYGSDLPAVRAAGLVDMPPRHLLDLLVDSARVHEYNHMSLGRQDVLVLQTEPTGGPFGGITKVVKSESKVWRNKTLQFTSLLHARELAPHSNTTTTSTTTTTNKTRDYLLVTRAVQGGSVSGGGAFGSEILLGVNVIRTIPGDAQRCMLISVNHLKSPIPIMIAKRIGLQAATNFIRDVQTLARTRAAK